MCAPLLCTTNVLYICKYPFINVSFLSYFLTLTPSVDGFEWPPLMQNAGNSTAGIQIFSQESHVH